MTPGTLQVNNNAVPPAAAASEEAIDRTEHLHALHASAVLLPLFFWCLAQTHPTNRRRRVVASAGDRWRPHSTAHCKRSFNQARARVRDANYPPRAERSRSPSPESVVTVHVFILLNHFSPLWWNSLLSIYGADGLDVTDIRRKPRNGYKSSCFNLNYADRLH